MSNPASKRELIRGVILELLPARARSGFKDGGIDASTRLLDIGLIDSTRLLDIILEVESRCGVQFNPESIDGETGITFGDLVGAFDPA